MTLKTETPPICGQRRERDGKCQGVGTRRERFSEKGKKQILNQGRRCAEGSFEGR